MSLRFPLGVRVNDGQTDRHVTIAASDLKYKKTAPGGFHSMSMKLNIDPDLFPDLGPADRIWIYGPDGRTLFEGFIDNPGRASNEAGVGYEISAMGTVVLASDQARALIYIDRDLEWEPYAKNVAASTASVSDDPLNIATEQGLLVTYPRGATVATNLVSQIGYTKLADAGMEFGAFRASYKSGKTDVDYSIELAYSGPSISSGASNLETLISTAIKAKPRYVGDASSVPVGANKVALRMRRTGTSTNIADDLTWTWFYNVLILGRRVDRFGVALTGAAGMQTASNVRSDWVVEDLIGRLLNVVDPNASVVEAGSFAIDQLAFADPVTAADVLDELEVYEPDFLWELLGSTPSGYVFNYRAWPTTVRYEVSTRDGYDAPGADFDLCNRIAVRWIDAKGKDRTTIVTAASAVGITLPGTNPAPTVFSPSLRALEVVNRVRDAESINLPEGRGSEANAQRAGEQALKTAVDPPKAATATVRRPIVDLLRGGYAMPYEIEPGYLVRVRETGDLLRLTEVEVDDEAGEAVLTLGTPVLTEEQRIVKLAKVAASK